MASVSFAEFGISLIICLLSFATDRPPLRKGVTAFVDIEKYETTNFYKRQYALRLHLTNPSNCRTGTFIEELHQEPLSIHQLTCWRYDFIHFEYYFISSFFLAVFLFTVKCIRLIADTY